MNYCVHIFLFGKKVLLLKRSKNNVFFPLIWTPIIGKIKEQEAPDEAVIRETIEETSLKVKENIYSSISAGPHLLEKSVSSSKSLSAPLSI